MPGPQLIVFSGLPGTGKSTLAEDAARLLQCPLFTKDQLEATLWRSGIGAEQNSGFAAYELLTTLAREQLRRGQSAVIDSVATFERIRVAWRELAGQHNAAFRVVECVCSDSAIHRRRLEGRRRGIEGWYEVSWDEVERVRSRYEPWAEARLIVDALDPLAHNRQTLADYLAV